MPTYEYQCTRCQRRFESFHAMSAAPVRTCERCGGKVKRLIAAPAVHTRSAAPAASPCGQVCPHSPGRRPCEA